LKKGKQTTSLWKLDVLRGAAKFLGALLKIWGVGIGRENKGIFPHKTRKIDNPYRGSKGGPLRKSILKYPSIRNLC